MRHRLFGRLVLALICGLSACGRVEHATPAADPASRRMTPSGEAVGFRGAYGSHVWLGIPYARPPVGALRWRAPEPPGPWVSTREALAFGSPCTQFASALGGVPGRAGQPAGSEDCLYLNLYAPADVQPGAARLPVMLWIHGGGNTVGQAGFYDGGNLAATERVVVVTVNYRLGPFGWFRHAALRSDGATAADRSGNFGTLDLVRALEWVQGHISAFGGDPGNVTVFGESAGGQNVFMLLLAPQAGGLFQRAIVQSGGLWMSQPAEAENPTDAAPAGRAQSSTEVLLRLLVQDRTATDREAAKARLAGMSLTEVERYLRGKTNRDILAAYTPLPATGMIDMPRVFAEGTVLPQGEPLARLARAEYHHVPVMLGTTRDENKLFLFGDPKRVRRLFWVVPRLRDPHTYALSAEYLARWWKATGADEPAAAMRAVQGPSVFVYRFDWDEEPTILGADLGLMLGAAHAFDIPFVFGHFDLGREGTRMFTEENAPGRRALAAAMMSYWAEFARHGAPGRGGGGRLPEWMAWDGSQPGGPKFLVLDTEAGGGVRMSADAVTREGVLAAAATDSRLATARDRCRIYREIAEWGRGFARTDYAARPECAPYPFESYPWDDS